MTNGSKIAIGSIAGLLIAGAVARFLPLAIFFSVLIVLFMWLDANQKAREKYNRELTRWYEQNPQVLGPLPQAPTTSRPERPPRSGWSIAGTSIAVIAAIGGLAIVGMIVVLVISFANSPKLFSNK
jgi:hypothetical protein